MKCSNCQRDIPYGSIGCPYCGAALEQTPDQFDSAASMPPNSQQNVAGSEQKANIGLCILSFLIPIAGLVVFLTERNKNKKTAKAAGICALVAFVLNLLVAFCNMPTVFNRMEHTLQNPISTVQADEEKQSAVWTDYTVTVEGNDITLPCSWNEFKEATGFNFQYEEQKEEVLQSSSQKNAHVYRGGTYNSFTVCFSNADGTEDGLKVIGISADILSETDIVFPGDLKIGDPADQESLTRLFGTPDDIYEDFYTWTDKNGSNACEISLDEGKLFEISIITEG